MSVRPYPSRDRALRQIMRHHRNEIPLRLVPPTREPQGPSGEYRLSTRRPGVVSGGD